MTSVKRLNTHSTERFTGEESGTVSLYCEPVHKLLRSVQVVELPASKLP